jgi:DNA-binding SARP family transcriptional activator
VDFRILGPLEVTRDGETLALPGGHPRALLAMLLLAANRTVARERLIDGLWGDAVPESAVKMVQIAVSRLRQLVPRSMLRTRPPGYMLELDPELIDLARFVRLADAGRGALAAGNAPEASIRLREALALWRGPALGEFSEPFAAAEAARLEELQLATLEARIDADLMRGDGAELASELELVTATHPLRERLRAQLMLVLYRSGRQADALAVYQDMRQTLDEDLGLRPSPELQQLHQAILRHDESLQQPREAGRPIVGSVPRAPKLRGEFVGRERELSRLEAALPSEAAPAGGAVLIVGPPGIGKTRLAQELSANAREAGMTVAWGRCYAPEAPPPYWPWREVIRSLAGAWTADELAQALASGAALIAALVPELGERLRNAPAGEPADDDPQHARFRLFDSVTSFLTRAAAQEPLLVVLDDVHAADADSLSLLAFLARQLPDARLLVVATAHDDEPPLDHPLAAPLGALVLEGRCWRGAVVDRRAGAAHPRAPRAGVPEADAAAAARRLRRPSWEPEPRRSPRKRGRCERPRPTAEHAALDYERIVEAVEGRR